MSYLELLVTNDIFVRQTMNQRKSVVYRHRNVGAQLSQPAAKACVSKSLHSGHGPCCK